MSKLLRSKELASELRRNVSYIYAMKRQGFKMPGGTGTVEGALRFLKCHPKPRAPGRH